ncbi:MAG: hypothetical protein R3F19_03140 [Verrucomicrobiales bacterium]
MEVPFEIRLSLRCGTVYYMAERSLTSVRPHYFIVVNADPLGDELLLLTIASSQIDTVKRRRAKEPPETVVEIPEADYAEFTKDSIVDCNQVFTRSLSELCAQWGRKEIVAKMDLPEEILKKLQRGVLDSRLVSETDKERIATT